MREMIDNFEIQRWLQRSGNSCTAIVVGAQKQRLVLRAVSRSLVGEGIERRIEHEVDLLSKVDCEYYNAPLTSGLTEEWVYTLYPWIEGTALSQSLIARESTNTAALAVSSPEGSTSQSSLSDASELARTTLELARACLSALREVHQRGLVARDIRPSHIVQTKEGQFRLAGYGALCFAEVFGSGGSEALDFASFASPELAGSIEHDLSPASDLYSLGLVLHNYMMGSPPFDGQDVGTILFKHLTSKASFEGISEFVPPVSLSFVGRLIEKDVRDRYQSADSALRDVELILDNLNDPEALENITIGKFDQRTELTAPSFVGRAKEMAVVQEHIEAVEQGTQQSLLAVGKSGMGKSRLLVEAIRLATQRGFRVYRSVASDQATQAPMGPMLEIVDEVARSLAFNEEGLDHSAESLSEYRNEICTVMPRLAKLLGWKTAVQGGPEELGQKRVLAAFCKVLELSSLDRPSLICVDDCQWLDKPSIRILEEFHKRTVRPIFLLLGSRPNEAASEVFREAMVDADTLEFGELSEEGIVDLIESMAGTLPGEAKQAVLQMAAGSPFLASAALHGLVESEALVASGQGWSVNEHKLDSFQAGGDSANVLIKRLEFVAPDALEVLSVGATIGKHFDLHIPSLLTGIPYSEAFRLLDGVREQGLIWLRPDGQLAFVHDKVREALREGMQPDTRFDLHRKIAEHFREATQEREFDIAYHFDAAQLPELAWPHALKAASIAREGHALESAEVQYRIAAKAFDKERDVERDQVPCGSSGIEKKHRYAIESGLAEVLMLLGKYRDSSVWLTRALENAPDLESAARIRLKQGELAFKRGDKGQAMLRFEEALREGGHFVPKTGWQLAFALVRELGVQTAHSILPERLWRGRSEAEPAARLKWSLHSKLAHCYWYVRDKYYTLWAHLSELNEAERYAPTPELAQAYSEHAPVMSLIPWQQRGLDYARKSLKIRTEQHDLWGQGQSRNFLSIMFYSGAKFEAALNQAQQAIGTLERTGDYWEVHMAQYQAAASMYRLGELKEAAQAAKLLYDSAVRLGDYQASGNAIDLWARSSLGEVPDEIVVLESSREKEDLQGKCHLLLASGVQHHMAGRYEEAIKCFGEAVLEAKKTGVLNAYISPNHAWLATSLRCQFESKPPVLPSSRRAAIRRIANAARNAVWIALRFHNELPHAFRELGASYALIGKRRRAHWCLKKSVAIAESQGAIYEQARSLRSLAELEIEFSGVSSERTQRLREAQSRLEQIENSVRQSGRSTSLSLIDRFDTLLDAGRTITASNTIEAILQRTCQAAQRLLRGERVHVIGRSERGRISKEEGINPFEVVKSLDGIDSYDVSLVSKADREQTSVTSTTEYSLRHGVPTEETGAFLVCPIRISNENTYFLYVANTHLSGIFGEDERRIASYLASAASGALERADGYEKLERMNESLENRVKERTQAVVQRSEELERTASELRLTQGALEAAKNVAERASESKSRFLACISHEIRTPMTAILGFTEVLRTREVNPEDKQKYLRRIHGNGQHLLSLLNEVLDLSKIEADRLEVESLEVNVYELISDAVASLTSKADEKGISLQFEATGLFPEHILSDPTRLRQIVLNLVGNAIKFTAEGGVSVTMMYDRAFDAGWLRFAVKDSGLGISEEQLARIFTPFEQAEASTTRNFGGTGLGLSISKRLAEALGGGIEVESTPGDGSQFMVTIDTGVDESVRLISAEEATEAIEAEAAQDYSGVLQGLRLLVADDVSENRELLDLVLSETGADLFSAENGKQAVDEYQTQNREFDLILMDMRMPVMDGYEATKQLRKIGCILPIVALTANASKVERDECIAAGCSEVVSKPIDFAFLVQKIQELVPSTCNIPKGKSRSNESPVSEVPEVPDAVQQFTDNPEMRDTFLKLSQSYVRELENSWDEFEKAIEEEDLEKLAEFAHTAKGTSGTFGLVDIQNCMAELEEHVRQQSLGDIRELAERGRNFIAEAKA
ncbi:MAG: ATP-binding protein [Pirellulaceae bacterium]